MEIKKELINGSELLFMEVETGDILYIAYNGSYKIYEFEEDSCYNLIDFINDFIEAGFTDFKIYESLYNIGLTDLIATVKDSEITSINV